MNKRPHIAVILVVAAFALYTFILLRMAFAQRIELQTQYDQGVFYYEKWRLH